MGIDLPAFEFLLRANREFGDFGATIVLGRQRILVRNEMDKAAFSKVLAKYRPDLKIDDIVRDYVDALIERLGGRPCHFMDNSAYEGAQVIHNLNDPLPVNLHSSYDTVIDIGTLEHVFNIGTGMKSMAEMVKVGGQFLCLNIANHHLGHGFWQFSPEVFFRTFSTANGYETRLADLYFQGAFHPLRDPEIAGRRLPIKTPSYTYITYGARRTAELPIFGNGWPAQADYLAAWTLFLARRAGSEGNDGERERILREAIAEHPKNPMYHMELSRVMRGRGNLAEADTLSETAYRLANDNDVVVGERNAVLKAMGKPLIAAAPPSAAATLDKPEARTAGTMMATAGLVTRTVSAIRDRIAPAILHAGNAGITAATLPSERGGPQLIDIGRIKVALDDPRMPQATRDALTRGRYEFKEREVARRLLRPGDRVIELGAGMGVVSLTIADLIGGEAVLSFEANPTIIELARENVARNELGVTLRHAIASPRPIAEKTPHIDFFVLNSFEASSTRRTSPAQKAVQVPAVPLEDEIVRHRANALVFDIEGFEEEIIHHADLEGIDKVIFEIHPKVLGRKRTLDLVSRLERQRLYMRQDLIFGDVIAFERGANSPTQSGCEVFAATLDFEEAMAAKDHERAARIAEEFAMPMADNAYLQYRLSLLDRACGGDGIAAAERSVTLGSGDFLLYADLGALYCDHDRLGDAERMLARLRDLFPRSNGITPLQQRITRIAS